MVMPAASNVDGLVSHVLDEGLAGNDAEDREQCLAHQDMHQW